MRSYKWLPSHCYRDGNRAGASICRAVQTAAILSPHCGGIYPWPVRPVFCSPSLINVKNLHYQLRNLRRVVMPHDGEMVSTNDMNIHLGCNSLPSPCGIN